MLLLILLLCTSTEFDWNGVNFLHSSSYAVVFYIYDQNSVNNTAVFQLLLNNACIAAIKAVSRSAPTASRLRVGKRLGGDTAGTADPSDQGDILYNIVSCSAVK